MPLAATADSPVVRRLGTLTLGLVLVAVGVAVTIRAELGVAPYDVLTTGVVALTDIPIGIAAMLLPVAFVVIGLLIGGRPGPGTVLAVLLVGPILGLALDVLPTHDALVPRLAYFVVGFVVIAAGITAVVISEIGSGPAELVMLAIHDRGYPLAPVRTGIELACVAIGWAMGGQVGVGTVLFALLIGPTLKRTLAAAGFDDARAREASDLAAPGA
ncbi:MAG: hypothetical protein ABL966_05700 [Acidimicrobiales bacterium]